MHDAPVPAWWAAWRREADAVLTPDRLEPRATALAVAVAVAWRAVWLWMGATTG